MKSIELFAGAGGLGMGVSRAGFEPVLLIERDPYCCATIRRNQILSSNTVRHWPLEEGDVRNWSFKEFQGKIDLVSGGPPCQPFSIGGKHGGFSDARDMFPEAVRAIREIRPKAFIFENVKGLTRSSFTSYFEYIRLQLTYPELYSRTNEEWEVHLGRLEKHHTQSRQNGLTYKLVSRVLNAADYGIPQKRERVFFVGFRADLNVNWAFPEATHSDEALIWQQCESGEYWTRHNMTQPKRLAVDFQTNLFLNKPSLAPWVTVRDAISDLPDPEKYETFISNHHFQPGARSYPGHTGSPLDQPAKTLKAGDHGVPGGENMLLRTDGSVRYFTVRESARLQTFPDEFVFYGSWTETMRQLGNAVPVKLAELIASSVLRKLRQ